MQQGLDDIMQRCSIIPVLVIDKVSDAIPLANALSDAGLKVLEVTLRTASALESIKTLRKYCPDLVIGAGTILTPDHYQKAVDVGSQFIVSPGVSAALLEQAHIYDVPFLPGSSTLSEMMHLYNKGYSILKFFPAELNGGVGFLKTVAAVMPDLVFCATGGINTKNASKYLALNNVSCIGGSWMAERKTIQGNDWSAITTLGKEAILLNK